MMRPAILVAVVLSGLTPVYGLYIRPDLEKIPVERLVKNLEDQAQKDPKNATIRFNLARLHGMAYAKKTDEVEINKRIKDGGPWFGYEPPFVPFAKTIIKTDDKAKLAAAQDHLAKAIEEYKTTLRLEPNHLAAQLGLAWTTEQSGDKKAAIEAYRKVIEAGWAKEKERKTGPLGGHYITKEASDYLIPLLDPEKNKDEVAELRSRSAHLMKLPRPITPIAIPLEDGLKLSDLVDHRASVTFDADGMGPRPWSWIRNQAGWLVLDAKKNGKIESGLQLFGNVTFWTFWENGYQALAMLDDNGDGELTGAELRSLAIWRDANCNGISEPGEVRTLQEMGIVGLSCRHETSSSADCAVYSPSGVRFRNGTIRPTYDVILHSR